MIDAANDMRSPEVLRTGGSIRYDAKVDLYAAGIILFEMLAAQRVYQTGMERAGVLRQLRGADICFPSGWPEAQLVQQTKIIRWLLDHDPAKRPSPIELLKSDLLPAKLEVSVAGTMPGRAETDSSVGRSAGRVHAPHGQPFKRVQSPASRGPLHP